LYFDEIYTIHLFCALFSLITIMCPINSIKLRFCRLSFFLYVCIFYLSFDLCIFLFILVSLFILAYDTLIYFTELDREHLFIRNRPLFRYVELQINHKTSLRTIHTLFYYKIVFSSVPEYLI